MRAPSPLRFVTALVAMNLRSAYAQRGAFWLQTTLMLVNDVVFFSIWWIFFARFPTVNGWRVADMMALHGIVAGSIGLSFVVAGGARNLARLVHEGELDVFLTRPKPVLVQAACSATIASGLGDVVYGIVMTTASGWLRPETLPVLVVAWLAASICFLAVSVIFHSVAFWAGDTNALARQAQDCLVVISGYPESIFGSRLRVLLYGVLPAGLVGWLPVALLREFRWPTLALLLGATAAMVVVALLVFRRGLRHYASGSRIRVGM